MLLVASGAFRAPCRCCVATVRIHFAAVRTYPEFAFHGWPAARLSGAQNSRRIGLEFRASFIARPQTAWYALSTRLGVFPGSRSACTALYPRNSAISGPDGRNCSLPFGVLFGCVYGRWPHRKPLTLVGSTDFPTMKGLAREENPAKVCSTAQRASGRIPASRCRAPWRGKLSGLHVSDWS